MMYTSYDHYMYSQSHTHTHTHTHRVHTHTASTILVIFNCNIKGDGQKFLGHFKGHFRSQISSESLKQGHIDLFNEANICKKSEFDYTYSL